MNKFGNYLRELRLSKHLSLRDFAAICDISHTHLDSIEKGIDPRTGKEVSPSLETVTKIANNLNIPLGKLLGLEEKYLIKTDLPEHSSNTKIPVLGRVVAGIPIDAIEDIVDYEDIPTKWLQGNKEYFGLKVKGNSMFPKYLENDTLIIRKQETIDRNGQSCIVLVNGRDATVKNVYADIKGIKLQPLNAEFEPMFYSTEEIDSLPVKILGVVIQVRRDEF